MESQSQDIGVWCKSLLCLKIGQRGFLCLQSWIKAFLQLGCAHSYPQKVWTRSSEEWADGITRLWWITSGAGWR